MATNITVYLPWSIAFEYILHTSQGWTAHHIARVNSILYSRILAVTKVAKTCKTQLPVGTKMEL